MDATTLIDRALIRLSGEGVRDFLQGLVTNDVTGDLPVWAALLTPQGKCLFDFLVWADGDDLLIDCETEAAEDLARRLKIYRLRRAIVIEMEPMLAVHWSLEAAQGAPDPRLPSLGQRWLAPVGKDKGAENRWRAHRLSLGVPEGRAELSDILWLECNAGELNGVSFSKGCYVGQENTARMNWRSTVNRRVVVVPITDADAKRQRVAYSDIGLSVEHRRVEDIPASAWRTWMGER
jgi:hypothetical protein